MIGNFFFLEVSIALNCFTALPLLRRPQICMLCHYLRQNVGCKHEYDVIL